MPDPTPINPEAPAPEPGGPARNRRGRPKGSRTRPPADRQARPRGRSIGERIEIAAGAGWAHKDIARALGLAVDELETRYADELTHGAYRSRLAVVEALYAMALRGRVAAAAAYLREVPQARAAEKQPPPLGKKAQAQVDAGTAHVGTEWESLLEPGRKDTVQ